MTLEQLMREYPHWHCWRSVTGRLVYGWRPRSSPPRVVKAPDVDGLRAEIEAEVRYREQRWG